MDDLEDAKCGDEANGDEQRRKGGAGGRVAEIVTAAAHHIEALRRLHRDTRVHL